MHAADHSHIIGAPANARTVAAPTVRGPPPRLGAPSTAASRWARVDRTDHPWLPVGVVGGALAT